MKGDINNDGTVDVDDLNAVINVMLGKSGHAVSGDVNGDNVTDIDDVNIIINIMIAYHLHSKRGDVHDDSSQRRNLHDGVAIRSSRVAQ